MKNNKNNWVNILKNIIGFALIIISVFLFGLKGMTVEMGIAVAASGIFLAFSNLEKFSKFKGAGFEAELKQVVNEANATIDNLKEVATPLLITNLELLANSGRFGDSDSNEDHKLFDRILSLQEKIGLSSKEIKEATNHYLNIHAWDLFSDIANTIEKDGNKEFSIKLRESIGTHSYDEKPSIKKLNELTSDIELTEKAKEKLYAIDKYFKKYKL